MKSLPVPVCGFPCRLSQLLSFVRAEIDYRRAVPPAATASLPSPAKTA